MIEPELIEIIEGPTPEFHISPQDWLQSILESPLIHEVALCQLRTATGADILERCQRAWKEGRPVRLDYPNEFRLRQQVDVVALRLSKVEEGELLSLWVALPFEPDEEEMGLDDEDDDFFASG